MSQPSQPKPRRHRFEPTSLERAIYRRAVIDGIPQRRVAAEFRMTQPTICRICRRIAAWLAALRPAILHAAALRAVPCVHESNACVGETMHFPTDSGLSHQAGNDPPVGDVSAFDEENREELVNEIHRAIAKSPLLSRLQRVQIKMVFRNGSLERPRKHEYSTKVTIQEAPPARSALIRQGEWEPQPAGPPAGTVIFDVPGQDNPATRNIEAGREIGKL